LAQQIDWKVVDVCGRNAIDTIAYYLRLDALSKVASRVDIWMTEARLSDLWPIMPPVAVFWPAIANIFKEDPDEFQRLAALRINVQIRLGNDIGRMLEEMGNDGKLEWAYRALCEPFEATKWSSRFAYYRKEWFARVSVKENKAEHKGGLNDFAKTFFDKDTAKFEDWLANGNETV